MTIIDIGEARRRRGRIRELAKWVMTNVPVTMDNRNHSEFVARTSDLTSTEMEDLNTEIARCFQLLFQESTDLEALAATLTGRYEICTRAASWMVLHPDYGSLAPDFIRLFPDITTEELMLATIELERRRKCP